MNNLRGTRPHDSSPGATNNTNNGSPPAGFLGELNELLSTSDAELIKTFIDEKREPLSLPDLVSEDELRSLAQEKSIEMKHYTLNELFSSLDYYREKLWFPSKGVNMYGRWVLRKRDDEVNVNPTHEKYRNDELQEFFNRIDGAFYGWFIEAYNETRKCEVIIDQLAAAIENYKPASETAPRVESNAGRERRFERNGEVWELSFDGKRIILPPSVGLRYLAMLLASPKAPIYCKSFIQTTGREQAPPDVDDDDLGERHAERPEGLVDRSTIAEVKKVLAKLEEDLAEARQTDGASDRIEDLEQSIADAKKYLERVHYANLGTSEDESKAAKSVGKAINVAIEKIGKQHKPLAEHLRMFIRTRSGTYPMYFPQGEPGWIVRF